MVNPKVHAQNTSGKANSPFFRGNPTHIQPKPKKKNLSVQPCGTNTAKLQTAASGAQKLAASASKGLTELLSIWGKPTTTPEQMGTERALAKGFNMEFDKSLWELIGIPKTEVQSKSNRDKAHVETIAANFNKMESDLGHYLAAPSCYVAGGPTSVASNVACFLCLKPETCDRTDKARDGNKLLAKVPNVGSSTSPVFVCPEFFKSGPIGQSEILLHESAHMSANLSDQMAGGPTNISYYGCPIKPVQLSPNAGPGQLPSDPAFFVSIADSYACFVKTQRENVSFFKKRAIEDKKREAEIEEFIK